MSQKLSLAFGTAKNFLFVAVLLGVHSLEALRPGTCPAYFGNVAWNAIHRCNYDEQCSSNYKCCMTTLGRRCLKPDNVGTTPSPGSYQKPGTCPPNLSGTSGSASDLCTNDLSCELNRKCCPTFVGKRCLLPASSYGQCPDGSRSQRSCSPGTSCGYGFYCSRGFCCPDRGSSTTTAQPSLTGCPVERPYGFGSGKFCLSNRDCMSPSTCCKYDGESRCYSLLGAPASKPGQCPSFSGELISGATNACDVDGDCQQDRKCCPTVSGKRCLRPE
uniref:WAP domain-containing protein n=1 Tax=Trichuris muris TaxID=70415 RepID=A0A5S6R229_TRIMR